MLYVYFGNRGDLSVGAHQTGYMTLSAASNEGEQIIGTSRYNTHDNENPATGEQGNATLNITSITGKEIRGTFSGTTYSGDGKKIIIKDGTFVSPVK